MKKRFVLGLLFFGLTFPGELGAVGGGQQHKSAKNGKGQSQALQAIATIHGGTGPFAVAGYRMGARALKEIGATKGSFSLEVIHAAPAEVQWSCMIDGLQAATGTSLGKLNLRFERAPKENMRSVVTDRATGKQVVLVLKESFLQKFLNTPVEKLSDVGKTVMNLPDDDIFLIQSSTTPHK
ncbi:MAG: formylmethanofuran dehydrogenase subunit E family protein [Blastocatellia bacterium]|nr:formylmethanofuran dehydrogenase subunit E family protein [Blastocatellia bacterium]